MIASGHGNQKTPQVSPSEGEDGQRAHHEQGHGAAALVQGDRRPARLLVGHQQPARAVQDQAGAAEEGEDDEGHAQHERVHVEVPGQAAGDAGDLPVRGGAAEPAEVPDLVAGDAGTLVGRRAGGCIGRCGGHGSSLRARGLPTIGDDPDPPRRTPARGQGGPGLHLMVRTTPLCDD